MTRLGSRGRYDRAAPFQAHLEDIVNRPSCMRSGTVLYSHRYGSTFEGRYGEDLAKYIDDVLVASGQSRPVYHRLWNQVHSYCQGLLRPWDFALYQGWILGDCLRKFQVTKQRSLWHS